MFNFFFLNGICINLITFRTKLVLKKYHIWILWARGLWC